MPLMSKTVKKPAPQQENGYFLRGLFLLFIFFITLSASRNEIYGNNVSNDPIIDITDLYYRGRFTESLLKLSQLVAKDPNNDVARLNLVRLLKESGKQREALTHLNYLVKKDPSNPRYRSVLNETAYLAGMPKIVSYKAGSTKPWNFPLNFKFQSTVEADAPDIQGPQEENTLIMSETTTQSVPPILVNRETVPEIRIGLASNIHRLHIKTGGNYRLSANGESSLTGGANEALLFKLTTQGTEIYDQKGKFLLKSWQPIILSYEEPNAASLIYDAKFADSSSWSNKKPLIYRGAIELLRKSSGLTVVNQVNLEEYLYAVVPSEIPASWPKSALEAQAVAARTYALANLGRFKLQGFDLLATPTSQAYNGVTQEAASVIEAVNVTRGMILTFEGKPASVYYYDNSGGYTESSAFVWGGRQPYLQALPEKPLAKREKLLTPDELAAWLSSQPASSTFREGYFVRGAYRWTFRITREQLESMIRSKARIGKIKAIIPMERGISGRLKRVMVKGTGGSYIITSSDFHNRIGGLRSTLFVVQPKLGKDGFPESFIFTGGGWGHGVGMSQSGAAGMALDGASVSEILGYYYPGTELTCKY